MHIGLHKTGTSSIQESLIQNKKKLKTDGILYLNDLINLNKIINSDSFNQLLADQLGISPAEILKNGRIPYIQDFDRYFSLSHSGNKVAVVIGDNRVGVDIEVETEKILRIKHKFVNDKEAEFINEADIKAGAAIVWGAKESMFKLYQKGALSYLNHLQLEAFKNNRLTIKQTL